MLAPGLVAELEAAGCRVTRDLALAKRVYWRVGGPAEAWVEVATLDQLIAVQASGAPVTVLGNGSNSLVHDAGIPGLVIRLTGELADLELDGTQGRAGGGLRSNVLLARLDKAGLGGGEPFSGIPGTLGGAVVMNAGSLMGETADRVLRVAVVLPGGAVRELGPQDLRFSYRHAELPRGAVVAWVDLALTDQDVEARRLRRQAFLVRRKATQPLDKPSCGSTFTNPPGDHAARLIDAAGLKGTRRGGAEISTKHANFIVNQGGATAEDIRWLIAHARCVVRDRFGVWMDPEVRLLGPWSSDALERP
jgi:UDP-N-acetylmuramate dehydrogenase